MTAGMRPAAVSGTPPAHLADGLRTAPGTARTSGGIVSRVLGAALSEFDGGAALDPAASSAPGSSREPNGLRAQAGGADTQQGQVAADASDEFDLGEDFA